MKNLKEYNLSKYALTKNGEVYSLRSNTFLKGWYNDNGYKIMGVTNDEGKVLQIYTHRMVATVYCPCDDPLKVEVNHIDGNKNNLFFKNLEWTTPSDNTQHAHDYWLNGGKNFSKHSKHARESEIHDPYITGQFDFTEDDVHCICHMLSEGYRDVDISRLTGYDRRYINSLRYNENPLHKDLVASYNFSFKKEQRASPELVKDICTKLQEGLGVMVISREFSVDRKLVGNIKNRKTFTRISSSYKW